MTPRRSLLADPVLWALLWVFSRLTMLAEWQFLSPYVAGDVGYYWTRLDAMKVDGIAATMTEYPTPVVWGMALLHGMWRDWPSFFWAFVAVICLIDALFTAALWRSGTAHRLRGVAFWVAFVPLVGSLCLFRFDLLPAVLSGAALLLARRRPAVAGGLIGLGAAIKLWPALLVLPLLAHRPVRGRTLAGFGVVGGGLGIASLLLSGWERTIAPLTWQGERGLQVESVLATPYMLMRHLGDDTRYVQFGTFNAFELYGPGVDAAVTATTVATALGMLVIAALVGRLFRAAHARPDAVALVMLAIIGIMIITNKTLSPQYVLWLGGPLAVGLLAHERFGGTRRRGALLALLLLVTAALTHLVYPLLYNDLVYHPTGTQVAVGCLVVRNLLLVVLTGMCCVDAWRAAGSSRRATH